MSYTAYGTAGVQVKSSSSSPLKTSVIRGAGWEIMEKVLKAGFLIPPMIINFKWKEKEKENQEIRFYPFISKRDLKKRLAHIKGKKSDRLYWMFDYKLKDLVYITLFTS